jgi:hypothetical protein
VRATPNAKPGPVRRPRQRHSATLAGCASGTVPQFEWTKSRGPVIEILASAVVVWQLKGTDKRREQKALRLIGSAFMLLALYIAIQSTYVLAVGFRPHHSQLGIAWLALT